MQLPQLLQSNSYQWNNVNYPAVEYHNISHWIDVSRWASIAKEWQLCLPSKHWEQETYNHHLHPYENAAHTGVWVYGVCTSRITWWRVSELTVWALLKQVMSVHLIIDSSLFFLSLSDSLFDKSHCAWFKFTITFNKIRRNFVPPFSQRGYSLFFFFIYQTEGRWRERGFHMYYKIQKRKGLTQITLHFLACVIRLAGPE